MAPSARSSGMTQNKTNDQLTGSALRHLSATRLWMDMTNCTGVIKVCRVCAGRRVGRLGDVGVRLDGSVLCSRAKQTRNRPLVSISAQSVFQPMPSFFSRCCQLDPDDCKDDPRRRGRSDKSVSDGLSWPASQNQQIFQRQVIGKPNT